MGKLKLKEKNNKKGRTNLKTAIVPIFAALLVAAILTFLFHSFTQHNEDILVAARPLTAETILTTDDLRWKNVPGSQVSRNSILRKDTPIDNIIGQKLLVSLDANQAITYNILQYIPGGIYAKLLPPGMLAIAIPAPSIGMIAPGDHVDILLTRGMNEIAPNVGAKLLTQPVLRNILVLGPLKPAPQPPEQNRFGRAPQQPQIIIVQVTPTQAQVINLAQRMGTISILVVTNKEGKPVYQHRYLTNQNEENFPEPPTMTIIQGASMSSVQLEENQ